MSDPQPKRFQCRHIFTDGRRCASPCLRGPNGSEDFCYFHHTSRGHAARESHSPRSRRASCRAGGKHSTFTMPLPEDRSAIQLAIGQVLHKIASNELDPRRAGLLLYGLQIASLNLPRTRPVEAEQEATETVEEITLDPALGTLAPQTDFTEKLEPKSSAELVLERLGRCNIEACEPASVLLKVHAVVEAQVVIPASSPDSSASHPAGQYEAKLKSTTVCINAR